MAQDGRKTGGWLLAVLVAFCIGWAVAPDEPRYGVIANGGTIIRWDMRTGDTELWNVSYGAWRHVPFPKARTKRPDEYVAPTSK